MQMGYTRDGLCSLTGNTKHVTLVGTLSVDGISGCALTRWATSKNSSFIRFCVIIYETSRPARVMAHAAIFCARQVCLGLATEFRRVQADSLLGLIGALPRFSSGFMEQRTRCFRKRHERNWRLQEDMQIVKGARSKYSITRDDEKGAVSQADAGIASAAPFATDGSSTLKDEPSQS